MVLSSDLVAEFKTFSELVDACVSYYKGNFEKMRFDSVRKNRVALSAFVEKFHRDCGTLTPEVQKKLDALSESDCVVVMSAHQPNLFAYSGVMRKISLTSALAQELEKRWKIPVVNFFGVADRSYRREDDLREHAALGRAVLGAHP